MTDGLSLYLHIPFCDTKCAYCDFNSYAGLESLIPAYVSALRHEAEVWSPVAGQMTVCTIFFGGGTPSLVPAREMASILQTLQGCYRIDRDLELSLEANPGTVDEVRLRDLRSVGFARISIGVQSFDDTELRALDRIHSGSQAVEAFQAARAAGFDNVNLDLIYGLAGQSLDAWARNVDRAVALRPEHLSLYALSVEEGTPLAYQVEHGLAPSPDPDLQADMYELAQERLAAAGYVQYEISNWALPGYECRHNLTYWRNGNWLGFGAGAHSSFGGFRFSDVRSPRQYIERVSRANRPETSLMSDVLAAMPQVDWQERIDGAMALSDTAILGLRLREGVSLREIQARHGRDLLTLYGEAIEACREAGLLDLNGDRLRLSNHGLLLANEVFTRLLPAPEPSASG